jgi:hypothetical protein
MFLLIDVLDFQTTIVQYIAPPGGKQVRIAAIAFLGRIASEASGGEKWPI